MKKVRINKFWKDWKFWIVVVVAIFYVALNIPLQASNNEADNQPTWVASAINTAIRVNASNANQEPDWLSNNNKRLIVLYPYITDCGIGIINNNSDTYASFIIRKDKVKIGDRRYIEGIVYYYTWYPKMADLTDTYTIQCNIDDVMLNKMLEMINLERDKLNFASISTNYELNQIALRHSKSMLSLKTEFLPLITSPYYVVIWSK